MELTGIVGVIMAREVDTLVGLTTPFVSTTGSGNIRLNLNHPSYATIYSLLMASAVNKKPIMLYVTPANQAGENFETINWAHMTF